MTDQANTVPTTFIVPEGTRRARADKVLATAFPDHSRVALQRSFDAGLVLVVGKPVKRDQAVSAGDVVEFSIPETKPSELKAVDIPLDIIFEDKHLLALNKESGMIVHPGAGTGEDTLVHALLSHLQRRAERHRRRRAPWHRSPARPGNFRRDARGQDGRGSPWAL